jgi:transketolase
LALAARLKGAVRRVFCLVSDGEWQEGSTFEALIFAAHHRLENLTILVDHNGLQGFGGTREVAGMEPLGQRLSGFDIDLRSANGHDLEDMRRALSRSSTRPIVAILDTVKGHGIPAIEGRLESHYLPLSDDQFRNAVAGHPGPAP